MNTVVQSNHFTRLSLPENNILTYILRSIIQHFLPDSEFENFLENLSQRQGDSLKLWGDEWDVLRVAAKNKSYESLDLLLMCKIFPCILKCLKEQAKKKKEKWGRENKTYEDLGEKIKSFRNYMEHVPRHAISKEDFDEKWKDLQSICLIYDKVTANNWSQILQSYQECVVEVDVNACSLNETQKRIVHSEVVLEEFTKKKLIKREWMKEMKWFYPTRACKEVERILHSLHSVTVAGNPGCGKSAIAQHVSLSYTSKNWTVIPVDGIKDIISLTEKRPHHHLLFVLNDPLGKNHVDECLLSQWKNNEKTLESYLKSYKNKVLFTCRTYVLNDKRVPHLLNLNKIIIDDAKWKLTKTEKENILDLYLRFPDEPDLDCETNKIEQPLYTRCPKVMLLSENEKSKILEYDEYFLQLCVLFAKHEKYRMMGSRFFAKYHVILRDEISDLKITDKMKFCALVILFAEGGIINSDSFLEKRRSFENTFDSCGLPKDTSLANIIEELVTLDGSFVEKDGNIFMFRDDKVMQTTAYIFGKTEQIELIRICPFEFLFKNINIDDTSCIIKTKVANICVDFTEHILDVICDRYFQEMKTHNDKVRQWAVLEDARVEVEISNRNSRKEYN